MSHIEYKQDDLNWENIEGYFLLQSVYQTQRNILSSNYTMSYGSDHWTLKGHEKKIRVARIRML